MQVHRQPRQRLLVVPHLRVLAAEVAAYGGCPSHDTLVHWLIDCGEIEAAATDALCPRHDATNPLTWTFRAATRSIADAVTASWLHRPDYVMAALDEFKRALCGVLELPRRRAIEAINRPISHGYAYHSLTPETFIHAALTLRRRFKPRRAFIVGLRGAGTSLSAIVASTLTIRGVICESLTVRAHNERSRPTSISIPRCCIAGARTRTPSSSSSAKDRTRPVGRLPPRSTRCCMPVPIRSVSSSYRARRWMTPNRPRRARERCSRACSRCHRRSRKPGSIRNA